MQPLPGIGRLHTPDVGTYVLEVTKLSAAGTPGQNLRPVGHIIWHNAINVPCNRLQTAVQGAGNDRIIFPTPYRRTCTD